MIPMAQDTITMSTGVFTVCITLIVLLFWGAGYIGYMMGLDDSPEEEPEGKLYVSGFWVEDLPETDNARLREVLEDAQFYNQMEEEVESDGEPR